MDLQRLLWVPVVEALIMLMNLYILYGYLLNGMTDLYINKLLMNKITAELLLTSTSHFLHCIGAFMISFPAKCVILERKKRFSSS